MQTAPGAEMGARSRGRDGLAAYRQLCDCIGNKASYESLSTSNVPLSLFGLTKLIGNLPRVGNPLHLELQMIFQFLLNLTYSLGDQFVLVYLELSQF